MVISEILELHGSETKLNSPFGDLEEVLAKPGEVMGREMESWVVENEAGFDLSSSRCDHDSLALGHSSKKGLRN